MNFPYCLDEISRSISTARRFPHCRSEAISKSLITISGIVSYKIKLLINYLADRLILISSGSKYKP